MTDPARLHRRHGWKPTDACPAALAQRHGLVLATRNTKDFNPDVHAFIAVLYWAWERGAPSHQAPCSSRYTARMQRSSGSGQSSRS